MKDSRAQKNRSSLSQIRPEQSTAIQSFRRAFLAAEIFEQTGEKENFFEAVSGYLTAFDEGILDAADNLLDLFLYAFQSAENSCERLRQMEILLAFLRDENKVSGCEIKER